MGDACEFFTDIHCHVLPGVDDGARNEVESLAMAAAAAADGTTTLIATPHQLGGHAEVTAQGIRAGVMALNAAVTAAGIGVVVLPGADVRIEPELPALLRRGDVLTLADRGLHVLLELPHELYFPLDGLLTALRRQGLTGILSHPERNRGIQARPDVVADVIRGGGLIQITAGSLLGDFGSRARTLAESLVRSRQVHFVASDGHDTTRRPVGLGPAHAAVAALTGPDFAAAVARDNPARVAEGRPIQAVRLAPGRRKLFAWLGAGAA
jgi:protein-tyrosine phosphatase